MGLSEAESEAKLPPECCSPTFQTWKVCSRILELGHLDGDHISTWADLKSRASTPVYRAKCLMIDI